MTRLNSLSIVLLSITLLFLTGCESGGGYDYQPWEFGHTPQAQEAPAELPGPEMEPMPQEQEPRQQGFEIPPAMPNQKPVKVAILLPLSGPHSTLGQSMLQAAQMAVFDIGYNAFELMPRDTKGTAEGASNAARSAADDGAQLILGPVFSHEVKAAKSALGFSKTNIIAFSTDWALAGGNTYIMGFLPFDQVERITTYAAARNMGRIGVLAPGNDYGRAVISSYQSISKNTALQTTEIKTYTPGAPNLSETVRNFSRVDQRMQQPQTPLPFNAVLMPSGGNEAVTIAGLLSKYGLHPNEVRRLGTGLFDDDTLAREQSLSGALFAAPSPGLRQDFENRFRSTYGHAAPRLTTLAYDATALASVLAVRGLEATGSPAFDRKAITNPNGFFGIDGIFRFRSNNTAERGLAILEFKNGQINIVEDAPKTFQKGTF